MYRKTSCGLDTKTNPLEDVLDQLVWKINAEITAICLLTGVFARSATPTMNDGIVDAFGGFELIEKIGKLRFVVVNVKCKT